GGQAGCCPDLRGGDWSGCGRSGGCSCPGGGGGGRRRGGARWWRGGGGGGGNGWGRRSASGRGSGERWPRSSTRGLTWSRPVRGGRSVPGTAGAVRCGAA